MKPYELFFRDEQYFMPADSLKEAKRKLAKEQVCYESEIESAFQHNYPVKIIKWGIGICILAAVCFLGYLIF